MQDFFQIESERWFKFKGTRSLIRNSILVLFNIERWKIFLLFNIKKWWVNWRIRNFVSNATLPILFHDYNPIEFPRESNYSLVLCTRAPILSGLEYLQFPQNTRNTYDSSMIIPLYVSTSSQDPLFWPSWNCESLEIFISTGRDSQLPHYQYLKLMPDATRLTICVRENRKDGK